MGMEIVGRYPTLEALQRFYIHPLLANQGYTVAAMTAASGKVWCHVRRKADNAGFIELFLVKRSSGQDGCWGCKQVCEAWAPAEVNCPMAYLEATKDSPGRNEAWRAAVATYHRLSLNTPSAVKGLIVPHGGYAYRLEEDLGKRQGWRVSLMVGGEAAGEYRLNQRALGIALRSLAAVQRAGDASISEACNQPAQASTLQSGQLALFG